MSQRPFINAYVVQRCALCGPILILREVAVYVKYINCMAPQTTRKTSFLLLCQMKHTYELPLSLPTESWDISGLFVPSNLVHFACSLSGGKSD